MAPMTEGLMGTIQGEARRSKRTTMGYHYNPSTGRATPCQATKRSCSFLPAFPPREDLERKYFSQDYLLDLQEDLLKRFQGAGFTVTTMAEAGSTFYHESPASQALPGRVESYNPHARRRFFPDKPVGVLWTSPGAVNTQGRVVTAWRQWSTVEKWGGVWENPEVYKVHLDPRAPILELDEESVLHLASFIDPREKVWQPREGGIFASLPRNEEGKLDEFALLKRTVPWAALQALGFAGVRVDGFEAREHFYGYDCDSLIVLRGGGFPRVGSSASGN